MTQNSAVTAHVHRHRSRPAPSGLLAPPPWTKAGGAVQTAPPALGLPEWVLPTAGIGLRQRPLLADRGRLLDDALTEFEALPQPFDLALVEADLGACLRRAGRRRAATQRLRHAEAALARLGAAPYLVRVRQELAACGLRPARDGVTVGEQLTPAEFAVARVVASGKSNREVATELVLSTKTVEHHLGRIYAKLRITSRTQLALQLADR